MRALAEYYDTVLVVGGECCRRHEAIRIQRHRRTQ